MSVVLIAPNALATGLDAVAVVVAERRSVQVHCTGLMALKASLRNDLG
jgi:hypothetical protein